MKTRPNFSCFIFILAGVAGEASGQGLAPVKGLFDEKKYAEACTILNRIKEGSTDYAEAQYFLGRIAVEEKHYEESVKRFEKAVEVNEKSAEYHNWLGVMYGVLAMDANALKQAYLAPKIKNEFERAAAIDPKNLPTQWGLINYYVKAPGFLGGSWDKALACAKTISSLNAAQGYRAYGFIHAAQKKTVVAEKELIQATTLAPNDPENECALAQFYADQKNYTRALAMYEQLIVKYPKNKDTLLAKKEEIKSKIQQ